VIDQKRVLLGGDARERALYFFLELEVDEDAAKRFDFALTVESRHENSP
jgi:hypothetical protein